MKPGRPLTSTLALSFGLLPAVMHASWRWNHQLVPSGWLRAFIDKAAGRRSACATCLTFTG